MTANRDLQEAEELPTAEEIKQRAYELYLEGGGEDGRALEHWLIAEEELKQKQASSRGGIPSKIKTAVLGIRGTVKTDKPSASVGRGGRDRANGRKAV
jgi:hypothetical protein